jgi:hypothetical protein
MRTKPATTDCQNERERRLLKDFRELTDEGKRVLLYLGRLYLARALDGDKGNDMEIVRVEEAIESGRFPNIPRLQ